MATTSIVDLLKSKNLASDYASRAKLAEQSGIKGYTGTADQNTQLISLLSAPPAPTPVAAAPVAPITPVTPVAPVASPVVTPTAGAASPALVAASKAASAGVPAASPVATPAAGTNYNIQSGDTLSAIAARNNTSVAELLKLNPSITNPNLIYAGKSLVLPGQAAAATTPTPTAPTASQTTPNYSAITTPDQANAFINSDQGKDTAGGASAEPPTRKTTEDYMKELQAQITPEKPKPVEFSAEKALTDARTQYGVTELETQVNDLKAQEAEILAQKQARTNAEKGKSVALNVISGRISEVEQQENERLGVIQRSIANATNQLATKYNVVENLMNAKKLDYDNAVKEYDKDFATNITLFNAAKGLSEEAKSEVERAQDTAKANAQIALNAYTARGSTYSDLSAGEQANLTKLGIQSGLGADFFANVMAVSGGKDILTTITGADDTQASIIYKDGTVKTVKTGLAPKKTASTSGGTTATQKKENETEANRQLVQKDIASITGGDGFVDTVKIKQLRRDIAINNPELLTWFDNAYPPADILNPNDGNNFELINKNKW